MAQTVTVPAEATLLPALLVAQATLQLLDLATTALALEAGGVEANPVSRLLIAHGWWLYGLVKLTVAAAFLALWPLVVRLEAAERRLVTAGMVGFGAFMAAVVLNNAMIAA